MQVSNFRFIGREVKEKGVMLMKTHHRVEMRQEVTGRKPQDLEFSDLFWVQMHKHVCVCMHFPTQGLYVSVEDYILKLYITGWEAVLGHWGPEDLTLSHARVRISGVLHKPQLNAGAPWFCLHKAESSISDFPEERKSCVRARDK